MKKERSEARAPSRSLADSYAYKGQTQLQDLPHEILVQIFSYLIPGWSLHVERHIRHACDQQVKGQVKALPRITYYIKRTALLGKSILCKEANVDISIILRINKYLSKIIGFARLQAFSGILELIHFIYDHQGNLETSTNENCTCSTLAHEHHGLRAALGQHVERVTACRLDSWRIFDIDLVLSRILPMARIACFGYDFLRYLAVDTADQTASSLRPSDIPDTELLEALWERIHKYPGWWSSFPRGQEYVKKDIHPSQEIRGIRSWSVNMIVESKIITKQYGQHTYALRPDCEYFHIVLLLQKIGDDDPVARILARYTREECEALKFDAKLKKCVALFRASL